jgi:hypothetical protein
VISPVFASKRKIVLHYSSKYIPLPLNSGAFFRKRK